MMSWTEMMRISHRVYMGLVGMLSLLLIIVGIVFYQYWQVTQDKNETIVGRVGTIAEIPRETPTVATVHDANKLSSVALRSRARNGDAILVYSKAKRLVVYRPSTQKIVEMLTINKDESP